MQIHGDHPVCAHPQRQRDRQVVLISAVDILLPVELINRKSRKTRSSRDQIILDPAFGNLRFRQLHRLKRRITHGDQSEINRRAAQLLFVDQPGDHFF